MQPHRLCTSTSTHTHTHTHTMHSFDPTRLLLSLGADVLAVDNNSCTGGIAPFQSDFMSYSVRYSSSLCVISINIPPSHSSTPTSTHINILPSYSSTPTPPLPLLHSHSSTPTPLPLLHLHSHSSTPTSTHTCSPPLCCREPQSHGSTVAGRSRCPHLSQEQGCKCKIIVSKTSYTCWNQSASKRKRFNRKSLSYVFHLLHTHTHTTGQDSI